jgi:hypothetical protein
MIKFKTIKLIAGAITFSAILFTQSAFAQKYKTAADTVQLNKEYGQVTLDIAKLNANLIEEQNKTSGYQSKSASTARNAVSSAQYSKETASTATNGNLADAKTAMKQAKKANNKANDADDAKNNQANNGKKIEAINEKIAKKQAILDDLARQKADIVVKSTL